MATLAKIGRIMGYISLGALALWVIIALGVAIGQAWEHHFHPEREEDPFYEKMEEGEGAEAAGKPILLVKRKASEPGLAFL